MTLALASLSAHSTTAQAARPLPADLEAASTTANADGLVIRSDTLTNSEPDSSDYDGLDPLDDSMTNPDIDIP